jgi:hypothetical protein
MNASHWRFWEVQKNANDMNHCGSNNRRALFACLYFSSSFPVMLLVTGIPHTSPPF